MSRFIPKEGIDYETEEGTRDSPIKCAPGIIYQEGLWYTNKDNHCLMVCTKSGIKGPYGNNRVAHFMVHEDSPKGFWLKDGNPRRLFNPVCWDC